MSHQLTYFGWLREHTISEPGMAGLIYQGHTPCAECVEAVLDAQADLKMPVVPPTIMNRSAAKHWIMRYINDAPDSEKALATFCAQHCHYSVKENKVYTGKAVDEVYIVLKTKHTESWIRKKLKGIDRCVKATAQQKADCLMIKSTIDRRQPDCGGDACVIS